MKAWVIHFCIITAICFSVRCYQKKFDQHPNEIEKFTIGLNGIQQHLSPNTCITTVSEYGIKENVACMVGYLLAPVKAFYGTNQDTMLFIFAKNTAPDNPDLIRSKKMSVIWQNSAFDIDYVLARKP
ncbi:MAG: hypothetical protein ACXVAU_13795 [Mucilaginibacter sp.]